MKNYKRKKIIFVILWFSIFLSVVKAIAQEEAAVISLFQKRVDTFEKFFSSKPKFLQKLSHIDIGTVHKGPRYVFLYKRFDDYEISYDIRKSDSLVSPYVGYITVDCRVSESSKCGDFVSSGEHSFTTLDNARQKRDDESCYKKVNVGLGFRFIFVFQKQKWVFKEARTTSSNIHVSWFDFDTTSEHYVVDNDFWKKLIE